MLATLPSISSMRKPSTWPVKPAAVALPVWTLKYRIVWPAYGTPLSELAAFSTSQVGSV